LTFGALGVAIGQATVPPGPNKVAFPENWSKGTMYATVDRPDTKQYREFYTAPEVLAAVRSGKPAAGQNVTWTNADDTPHQITLVGGDARRSDVMLKGQSATMQFDAAGNIACICGLHPTMKGTIEVAAK
jgi:hypothetical protein